VIEARDVPGGRVRTIRNYFDDGLHAEAGPNRISDTHLYMVQWLNEFGLSLVPFGPSDAAQSACVERGAGGPTMRRCATGWRPTCMRTNGTCRRLVSWPNYVDGLPEELGSADFDASNPRWAEYDRVTWPAWLASRGASKGAIDLMMLGGGFEPVLRALSVAADHAASVSKCVSQDRGRHGPLALGNRGHVERRHPLWLRAGAARTGAGGIRALCREKDRMTAIAADRVLIAIPFFDAAARRYRSTVFTRKKPRQSPVCPITRRRRFLLQTRSRFLAGGGAFGKRSDQRPADIWDTSFGQEGGAAFLPTQREIRRSKRTWRPCLGRTGPGLASR